MNGIRGYNAWRWIFILEGLLTCVIAFAAFFIISDFPDEAKWLSEDERTFIEARLQAEQGSSTENLRIGVRDIVQVFKDYKIYLGGIMYFSLIVPAYGMYCHTTPAVSQTLKLPSKQLLHTSLPPSFEHTAMAESKLNSTQFPLTPPPSHSPYF